MWCWKIRLAPSKIQLQHIRGSGVGGLIDERCARMTAHNVIGIDATALQPWFRIAAAHGDWNSCVKTKRCRLVGNWRCEPSGANRALSGATCPAQHYPSFANYMYLGSFHQHTYSLLHFEAKPKSWIWSSK